MKRGIVICGQVLGLMLSSSGGACSAPRESPSDRTPEKAEPARGAIVLLARVAERAGVRTAAVKQEHLARPIHAPAEITLDPDRTAHLSPLVDARVEKVDASLGDRVKRGQLLAVLRSVAVGESRASLAQARADLELAHASLARQQELRASQIGATRAYEEAVANARRAEAAEQAARERSSIIGAYELRAPIDGTVIERHATIGEIATPASVVFTVADLAQVWVVAQVYERDLGGVVPGANATLALEAYPGRAWSGKLAYVAGALEHETRTLPVRLVLDNPDGTLRPGLFGALSIEANDAIDALAVPAEAVQRLAGKALVFVKQPGSDEQHVAFTPREVGLGRDAGAFVEITSGLRAGDDIAVSGTFTLRGEMTRDTLAGED